MGPWLHLLDRREDHRHHPALEARAGLDLPHLLEILRDAKEYVPSQFGVRHLPSPKHHGQLDLVSFFQEPPGVTGLEFVVVVLDPGAKLHLFDLNVVLLLFRLPSRPLRLVLVLPVVHEFDHRRPSLGSYFHEIQPSVKSEVAGLFDRNDADLPTLVVDQTDWADPYLLIYTNSFLANIPLLLRVAARNFPVPIHKKNPDLFRVTRSRKPQAILQAFHVQDPAVSNIGCGTERWSRLCVGPLPSCLGPRTPGSRRIGGISASVKARNAVGAVGEEPRWHTGGRGRTVRSQSTLEFEGPFMGVGDATRQEALLEGVSRTFALTIPTLPEDLRPVIGNAYLLCRIVDTVEDEPKLSPAQKKEFSEEFVRVVRGEGDAGAFSAALGPLLSEATLPSVHDLIHQTAAVLGVMRSLSPEHRAALERCVTVMANGMVEFQQRGASLGLADQAAMDRYCYHVAVK